MPCPPIAKTPLLLALLLVHSSITWATTDAFEAGVNHFKSGDYAQAVTHFKHAARAGNTQPTLHYNLGASYFKLGRYRAAQEHFLKISQDKKLGALASYNLGLVAHRLKNSRSAIGWFRRTIDLSTDPKLRRLASNQIKKLTSRAPNPRLLTGFFSAGFAAEDNVTRINEEITLNGAQEDHYWNIYGNLNYQLAGNRSRGTQIRLGIGLTRYKQLNNYDQGLLNLGLYQYAKWSRWRFRYGLHYFYDELNDSGFQERLRLSTRAIYRINRRQQLRLSYALSRLNELNPTYAYLSGQRQRLKVEHILRNRDIRLRLRYTLELNDREDRLGLNSFTSYSPTRHTLLASIRSPLSEFWRIRTDLEYRYSGYPDANITDIATNLVTAPREDQRWRASLYATYQMSRHTDLEIRYRHTRNRSNLTNYQYRNNSLLISVDYYF